MKADTKEKIILAGNPNVGKSVIFQRLTGKYAIVSNYPGTTVEISEGKFSSGGIEYTVVDCPGVQSLLPMTEDERVTRDIVIKNLGAVVVQVMDAKNIARGLVLTQQLSELGVKTVIALNMFDEASRRGIKIDPARLSELTGTVCVPTVATIGTGIEELKKSIVNAVVPAIQPVYDGEIEKVLREARAFFPKDFNPSRGILASLAAGELSVLNLFRERIPEEARAKIEARVKQFYSGRIESPRFAVRRSLFENAQRVALDAVTASQSICDTFADRLGKALIHRFWGLFFLAFILYFTYRVVGVFAAQFLVDNIENRIFGGRLDIGFDENGISSSEQKLRILPGGDVIYPENSYAKSGFVPLTCGEGNYVKFTAQKRDAGEYVVEADGVEVVAEKEVSFVRSLFNIFIYDTGGGEGKIVEKPLSGVEYRLYYDKEIAEAEKIGEVDKGVVQSVRWMFKIDSEKIPEGGTEIKVAVYGGYIIPFVSRLLEKIPWKTVQDIFVGKYGLFTVAITYSFAIIFPIILFFFLIFSFLEDTGYLPRLALMTNRFFKFMGLNGKVVLPMLLGLGCDTMAVLTTRILHTKRDRLIAVLLLTLAIPCSAQLGVITATASKHPKVLLVFASVILISLLFVGFLTGKLVRGEPGEFIIELPPIRLPKFKNIAYKTLSRLEWYLKEAIPLFILGTFLLYILDTTGMLEVLKELLSPVTQEFLGLPPETARGFILGFLRRDYGIVTAIHGIDLSANQLLVVITTITLFIPCVAQFFMVIKEQGCRRAFLVMLFVIPFALLTGGALNFCIKALNIDLGQ